MILPNPSISAQSFEKHLWKDRVIVLLAEKDDTTCLKQMQLLLSERNGLKERKLVIYHLSKDLYKYEDPKESRADRGWKPINADKRQFAETYRDYKLILLGLDGGVKLKTSEIVTVEDLFTLIDGMPMRKVELGRRHKE